MQPNSKTFELVDKINAFANSKERDEFTRRALDREIESMKNVDPAIAFAMGGMLAAAIYDESAAKKQFEAARRLRPDDSLIELNYSKALSNLGLARDARETARTIFGRNSGDLHVLDELISLTLLSGRVLEASELIILREQLKPQEEHPNGEIVVELDSFCRRHNLQDDEVEPLLELTLNVLHDAGFYHVSDEFRVAQDGESEWFSWSIEVAKSLETVVELNAKLAETMATVKVSPELSTSLNIMFVPASA